MVRYAGFSVTRYARGAGGITPFWAACDRDYTQEIVPFAATVLFKSLAPKHSGLSTGRRNLHGDTVWDKGIWLGELERTPEHIVGTKNGAMGARTLRRLVPTKRSETSLLLEMQGVPWDLVPNAPRCGRRKRQCDTQIKQFKRQLTLVVIINTCSEWNSATCE